jgi:hypothetical protein
MTQMAFTDTMNVVYQLNSKKYNARDIKVDFTLLNTFQPYNTPFPETGIELIPRKNNEPLPAHIVRAAESKANIKLAEEKYKVMKTVVIKTTKKSSTQELDEKLSSGMFSTADATLFDFVNNPRENLAYGYTNILEWLRGRVPGLTVERDETGTLVPFIRQSRTSLFVDEVQVQPDYLEGFPVADIALIKVIRGVFLGVAFGSQGAIAIYTRRGDMGKSALFPGMPSSRIVGYRTQPKFFAPDYASGALSDYKDTREIMFWSPLLIPDFYNNAATIKFNNNDIAKSLRVIVTGFSNTGEIIYMNKVISQ